MPKSEKVWYACYGSNLLEARFHCYIEGGQPQGATRIYTGCRDKTLPTESKPIQLDHELYFAKSSKTWNGGGVAFVKPERDVSKTTYGKRYLITRDQFTELVKQEIGFEGPLQLDLEKAKENGGLLFDKDAWYGQLLYLGDEAGCPIFSFTNHQTLSDEINPPDEAYLSTIIKGLKSCYALSPEEVQDYFSETLGIKGFSVETDLKNLL